MRNEYLLVNGEKKCISTASNQFNRILECHTCHINSRDFYEHITGIKLAISRRIRLNLTMNIDVYCRQYFSSHFNQSIDWLFVVFEIGTRTCTLTLVSVNGSLSSKPPCNRKPHGIFPSDRLMKTLFIWSSSIQIEYPLSAYVCIFYHID